MPTIAMRGPGSCTSTATSTEAKPAPATSSHAKRTVGPATALPAVGGNSRSAACRAALAAGPASSGNITAAAVPFFRLLAIAVGSIDRSTPMMPPMRLIWKPKPSCSPGVKPAERAASKDGPPLGVRDRLASAATWIVPTLALSSPAT